MSWQIAFVLVLLVLVLFEILHFRRIDRLINRLMARDYQEFQYYEEKYKRDLAELDRLRKTEHKGREVASHEVASEEARQGELGEFEETW